MPASSSMSSSASRFAAGNSARHLDKHPDKHPDTAQHSLRPRHDHVLERIQALKEEAVVAAIQEGRSDFRTVVDSAEATEEAVAEAVNFDIDASSRIFADLLSSAIKVEERHRLIDSTVFKTTISIFVLVNTVTMGLEVDYPELSFTWTVFENTFCAVFFVEMSLKLHALGRSYFSDRWNLLDFFLVWMAVLDTWVFPVIATGASFGNAAVLRMLRLMRLVRIVRLVKQFKQFVLVVAGVLEAMEATFWVCGVLAMAIYVGAVLCCGMLGGESRRMYPGNSEVADEIDETEMMMNFNPYTAFGTISRSMLTLFNITILAEWTEVVRPIMEKQPLLVFFFIFFVMFVAFGVMNVIIGMIVDDVMENARVLQQEETEQKQMEKVEILKQIQQIVAKADTNHNGFVTLQELDECMADPESGLSVLVKEVGLPRGFSPAELLCMLDNDGSGDLDHNEFIQSFFRLMDSGPFHQICLLQTGINSLKFEIQTNRRQVEGAFARTDATLASLAAAIEAQPPKDDAKHEETLRPAPQPSRAPAVDSWSSGLLPGPLLRMELPPRLESARLRLGDVLQEQLLAILGEGLSAAKSTNESGEFAWTPTHGVFDAAAFASLPMAVHPTKPLMLEADVEEDGCGGACICERPQTKRPRADRQKGAASELGGEASAPPRPNIIFGGGDRSNQMKL